MAVAVGCMLHIILFLCTRTSGQSADIDFSSVSTSLQPTPSATFPLINSTIPAQPSSPTTATTPTARIPTTATTGGAPSASPMFSQLYVIVLGATTGFFFFTTIISTLVLEVMCCRRREVPEKGETTDGIFGGTPVSLTASHGPGVTGVKDLPVWSVGTFTDPNTDTNNYHPEPVSPRSTIKKADSTTNTGKPAEPTGSKAPKRVAPPPPKSKKEKKAAAKMERAAGSHDVEYAVPITSRGHWFSRKRKETNSEYKELNLKQVEAPNPYATPQVP